MLSKTAERKSHRFGSISFEKLSYFYMFRSSLTEEIDVADEEGNVKNIRDLNHKYASDVLTERENLILLKIESKYNKTI